MLYHQGSYGPKWLQDLCCESSGLRCPGPDSDNDNRDSEVEDSRGMEMWKHLVGRQGRDGQFSEIGDVVVLMATPRMSLVNGQNLFIDGGFTINEGNGVGY